MWRTAVLLFNGLLLCLVGSLFVLRRESFTTHWIVFVGDGQLYRITTEGESLRPIVVDKVAMFAVSPVENSIVYFHTEGQLTSIKQTSLLGSRNETLSSELNPR